MKRLLLISAFIGVLLMAMTPPPDKNKVQLKQIDGISSTLTPTEVNQLDSIDAAKGKVQKQLDDGQTAIGLKADSTYLSNLSENVQQGLNIRLDSLLSDAKYVLKGDSASLYDYVYRKGYIDTLEMKLLKDERVYSFQKLGADTLFFPIGTTGSFSSTAYSLVDNTSTIMSYDIPRPSRVRGVYLIPSATGNAEWDGWNGFVLLNSSGTRIDSTANTAWTHATGNKRSVSFVNQAILAPGIYYLVQVSNWVGSPTTQPAVYTLSGVNAVQNYFISSSHKFSATLAGQTTNPSSVTISTTTNSSTYPGFILYE